MTQPQIPPNPPVAKTEMSDGAKQLLAWLGAIAFAVVVIWLVVYLYANDILKITGPFAIIGLLPMLFLIRTSYLRSRIRKNARKVGLHLNRATVLVQGELSVPPDQRSTRGSDASLLAARSLADTAQRLWQSGQYGHATSYIGQLSECARGWEAKAALTQEVIGALRSVQKQIQAVSESQDAHRDFVEDDRNGRR